MVVEVAANLELKVQFWTDQRVGQKLFYRLQPPAPELLVIQHSEARSAFF